VAPTPIVGDAATPAATPDAGVAASAPSWIFKYATKDRSETWTLRYADGVAELVVVGAQTTHYFGTEANGKFEVTAPTAKLSLDCEHEMRPLSTKCNDAKAKPVDVLACYHPDFKSPMTFGAAPGIEYVVDPSCNGFRLVP
jgi:hypothetical protein